MEHEITVVDLSEQPTAVVRDRAVPATIPDVLGRAFEAVARVATDQGRRLAGPPFARYRTMDEAGWDIEAGFPVDAPVVTGPYDTIGGAWNEASAWLVEHGYAATDAPWESYLDEPGVEQPRTLIVMPCEPARR